MISPPDGAMSDFVLARSSMSASHGEEASLNFDIAGQCLHRAMPVDLALFQHIGAIRNELGEMDILFGQAGSTVPASSVPGWSGSSARR